MWLFRGFSLYFSLFPADGAIETGDPMTAHTTSHYLIDIPN
jgi:hypothetical protein